MPKVATNLPHASIEKVDWEPVNWFAATWRENLPLRRTEARSFDLATAKKNIEKLVVDWHKAPCELGLSTDEALFWFSSCFGKGLGDCTMLEELKAAAHDGGGKIELETMKKLLKKTRFEAARAHGLVPIQILETLMHGPDLVQLLCESPTMPSVHIQYRKRILPFLEPTQKNALHRTVEQCLGRAQWESDSNFAYFMAACLGMHDVTSTLVNSWSDSYGDRWDMRTKPLQLIVFGLGSAESMVEHFLRLNLMLIDSEHAICWIAHTLDTELDTVWRCIRKSSFVADTEGMVKVIACIKSAATAEFMFDRLLDNQFTALAEEWMRANPQPATEALIAISSREGNRGDNALTQLRKLSKQVGESIIRQTASTMPPHLVRRLNDEFLQPEGSELSPFDQTSTPEWLELSIAGEQKSNIAKKPPVWLDLIDLPPLVIEGHRLNQEQLAVLINCLQQSTLESEPLLTSKLRTHAEARSLDRFAWFLFDSWLRNGGSSKDNWAMFSLAFLGSDAIVPRLAQLIRIWPGESNHKRAVVGLECLRTIGSDTALMQINAISEKIQFKGLKGKAEECMAAIADTRQLSRERLGDRIIPRLEFERSGERTFDFGRRTFIVSIGPDFKTVIVDEAGKQRTDLPTPNPSDDPDLAPQAVAEFKLLKKGLRDLLSAQSTRLEQAMVMSRRWFTDEFTSFLLNHPLMPPLLQQFVWGGFDMMGKLKSTFVIVSKDKILNVKGETTDLSAFSEIALLHPLQIDVAELALWQADFQERKIEQAFPQLNRPVQRLTAKEEHDVEVLRLRNVRLPAVVIVSLLDKHGWERGPVMDGGLYTEHLRYFPRADLTAVVAYEGITTGMPAESADQHIDYCAFLPGKVPGEYSREFQKGMPLITVDPVVLSEVLSDLELIKAKGVRE
jgi:Domain of unknown function (DUF4132)